MSSDRNKREKMFCREFHKDVNGTVKKKTLQSGSGRLCRASVANALEHKTTAHPKMIDHIIADIIVCIGCDFNHFASTTVGKISPVSLSF